MAGQHSGHMPYPGYHQQSPSTDNDNWATPEYPTMVHRNGHLADPKDAVGTGFFKTFGGMQKKTTRDGQPAKRRGPKPDSKPAQTRRQELNRQAQRTHRERKEQYIKGLEQELGRLQDNFMRHSEDTQQQLEQQRAVIQNQQQELDALREILASRGIPFQDEVNNRKMAMSMNVKRDGSSSMSPQQYPAVHPGYTTATSTVNYSPRSNIVHTNGSALSSRSPGTTRHSASPMGTDNPEIAIKQEPDIMPPMPMPMPGTGIFEREPQLEIDFLLRLERPCRDHQEYLARRSLASPNTEDEALISGHALMVTYPTQIHLSTVPSANGGLTPTYPHSMPAGVQLETLRNLYNMSSTVRATITDGQLAPIHAMQILKSHRHYQSLTREDILWLIESILGNVRCYGFGAVMEGFELRDALSSIFASKPEIYQDIDESVTNEVDDMYS